MWNWLKRRDTADVRQYREERVEKAATLLDNIDKWWFEDVDLKDLNLADYNKCVLGQSFRFANGSENGYAYAMREHPELNEVDFTVFASNNFKPEWKKVIKKRRKGAAV